jgi:hypothetical protein
MQTRMDCFVFIRGNELLEVVRLWGARKSVEASNLFMCSFGIALEIPTNYEELSSFVRKGNFFSIHYSQTFTNDCFRNVAHNMTVNRRRRGRLRAKLFLMMPTDSTMASDKCRRNSTVFSVTWLVKPEVEYLLAYREAEVSSGLIVVLLMVNISETRFNSFVLNEEMSAHNVEVFSTSFSRELLMEVKKTEHSSYKAGDKVRT